MDLSRRTLIGSAAACALARPALSQPAPLRRTIPSSGETLTALGIGTSRRYEVEPIAEKVAPLTEAVQRFLSLGGTVIDTAPSYGTAEDVLGLMFAPGNAQGVARDRAEAVQRFLSLGGTVIDTAPSYGTAEDVLGLMFAPGNAQGVARDRVFLASKVSERGREAAMAQVERSFRRMGVEQIDLIAVHNLIDTDGNLALLRDLKRAGRIRYVGVTVWLDQQFEALEAVMRREPLDFVQVNYALDQRKAAERILPLARERGVAVMVNVPFGRDRLFAAVKDKPLPDWAAALDCRSWAQVFLKYVLANQAVTCPIPGMAKAAYVSDNMGALAGRLPDAGELKTMERFIDAV